MRCRPGEAKVQPCPTNVPTDSASGVCTDPPLRCKLQLQWLLLHQLTSGLAVTAGLTAPFNQPSTSPGTVRCSSCGNSPPDGYNCTHCPCCCSCRCCYPTALLTSTLTRRGRLCSASGSQHKKSRCVRCTGAGHRHAMRWHTAAAVPPARHWCRIGQFVL
jgi:hypothetical protein